MKNHWPFSSNNIYLWKCQKALREKKNKEDEQTLAELNSAHSRSKAKCLLVHTSYIKRIKLFLFAPWMNEWMNEWAKDFIKVLIVFSLNENYLGTLFTQ